MKRSEGQILTTHAGSLPRPARLTELFAQREMGFDVDEVELTSLIDEAVADSVAKQVAAGIDVGNNGEQTREAFFLYAQRRMSGFSGRGERRPLGDVESYPEFQQLRKDAFANKPAVSNFALPKITGEVRYLDPQAIVDECAQFRQVLDAADKGFAEAFMSAPSPGIIAAAIQNEHYDSFEAYVDALADALAVEYHAVVDAGFLLQLDCPDLALERHVSYIDRPLGDFIEFIELIVASINRALAGIPPEKVRLHVCWGNYEGPHDRDVALADIQAAIMTANVGAYMFPLANPRHAHEWRCFADGALKDDQLLIAGVLDTTTNFVEHPEVIAERLERVAGALGDPSRVMAATDCGFETSAGMGRVAEDVMWAKFRAMREGADLASSRLFA